MNEWFISPSYYYIHDSSQHTIEQKKRKKTYILEQNFYEQITQILSFFSLFEMNLFSRKSAPPPPHSPTPSMSNAATAGPEAFASNSAYGRGFFEPNAYSIALKRCENGHDLAQQLADMLEERAQLESVYTNQLRAWSRKWHTDLVKSQEYGTTKKVWDQTVTTGRFSSLVFFIREILL